MRVANPETGLTKEQSLDDLTPPLRPPTAVADAVYSACIDVLLFKVHLGEFPSGSQNLRRHHRHSVSAMSRRSAPPRPRQDQKDFEGLIDVSCRLAYSINSSAPIFASGSNRTDSPSKQNATAKLTDYRGARRTEPFAHRLDAPPLD